MKFVDCGHRRNHTLLSNESGISLLQTLMASGLMALGALAITNLFTSQNKENKRISQKISITDFQNSFLMALQDSDVCRANLDSNTHSGLVFDSTQPNPKLNVNEFRVGILPTSPLLAEENLQVTRGVLIGSMTIENLSDTGTGVYSGEWVITLKNANPKERNFNTLRLGVQNFFVDTTNPNAAKITDCQPINSGSGSSSTKWALNGNDTSALASAPWFGTTSDHDIIFKRFNVESGRLSLSNTSLGLDSLKNTGSKNLAIGANTLRRNITGESNTAIGESSLNENEDGSHNTMVGASSGNNLVNQSHNTGIGVRALGNTSSSRTTNSTAVGPRNLFGSDAENSTAIGWLKGADRGENNVYIGGPSFSTISGTNNVGIGNAALQATTSGSFNTAVGDHALGTNEHNYCVAIGHESQLGTQVAGTSTSHNTSAGFHSMRSNISGNYNSAFGARALYSNRTGHRNSAFGTDALYFSNANDNTAAGFEALKSNTTGIGNTAIGAGALLLNNGNYNTALGSRALASNVTGSNNTAIGYGADVSAPDLNNATAIGNGAIVNSSNKIRLGNTAVSSVEAAVPVSVPSDERLKENIQDYRHGLNFILKLRPVTYKYNSDPEENIHSGFIAQEVESIKVPFPGLHKPEKKGQFYSLSYSQFVVPIVNAVKEIWLKVENLTLRNRIKREKLKRLKEILKIQEEEISRLEKQHGDL